MKKKNIIIIALSALVLAGATVGAVYALDKGISSEVIVPNKTAVLAKDDPSIEIDLADALAYEGVSDKYDTCTEDEKTYFVERAKVRSVIDDVVAEVMAENPGLKDIHISESECMDMTKEQIKLYADLIVKIGAEDKHAMEEYPRVLAQAKGELALDAPRLSVDALNEIASQCADIREIYTKVREQYDTPDEVLNFSGIVGAVYSFWLDDEANEVIVFSFYDGEADISLYNAESDTSEVLYSGADSANLFAAETAE